MTPEPSGSARPDLVRTYVELVRTVHRLPTLEEVESGSGHSVHAGFDSLEALGSEALAELLTVRTLKPPGTGASIGVSLATRIRWQVAVRSAAWETVLPFWRVLTRQEEEWPALAARTAAWRRARLERLGAYYAPEMRALPGSVRRSILISLDAMTDYEGWARLRQGHGRSVEEARAVWCYAAERLLADGAAAGAPSKVSNSRTRSARRTGFVR